MKKEVYVMYEQRYGELIVDNPPAEILGVYSSEEKAREELKNQVFNQDEGWVVDENNEILNMNDISVSSFEDMLDFMTDFLRAFEEVDKER